jgi:anti-anti-sigma factor
VLKGELDLATLGVAEEALKGVDESQTTLILDLRDLGFLDSSGLRLILTAAEEAKARGSEVYVVKGPAQVNRVFELTGAGERLNLVDDPSSIAEI